MSDTVQTTPQPDTYVAFCDILGFSEKTVSHFDETLEIYKAFASKLADIPMAEIELTMYSDSILLTAKSLGPILWAVQALWFFALAHDMMIRGAITKGKYWELRRGKHLLVVSDALVRAVKLERMVGVPAVVIADDTEIEDDFWLKRFWHGALATPLLHFRDRNIVNPFNEMWHYSAGTRARLLMEESPRHKDKYLWFLALHYAVGSEADLIPPDTLAKFLRLGVIKRIEPAR